MSEDGRLADRVQVLNGFAFPSSGFTAEEGLPLVRIRDIASGRTEVNFRGKFDTTYLLKNGDVLIGMDGDFLVSRWSGGDALLNQRVCKVTSNSPEIDQAFLFWFLQPHIDEIHRKTPQTTVRHLSTKDVRAIPEPELSVTHQTKIAKILDTLDTAIRGTEAVVAKLKAMKLGLLDDLLTRGIDANGDLRPPQPEAPHLYKQTSLGWLPKEWGEVTIKELARSSAIGPFGSDLVASDYRAQGIPVVFVRDIKPDAFFWKSNVFLDERKAQSLSAHKVTSGDVVATKMGFPPCISAVYPADLPDAIITADVVCIRPNVKVVRPEMLSISMNSPRVQRQVDQITAGVTRPKVTLRDVRELKIALPLLDEQFAILKRTAAVDNETGKNAAMLNKLRLQKSGLMDDLLTGRVPVTPLL